MSLSYATTNGLDDALANGRPVTSYFERNLVLTSADTPEFVPIVVETDERRGPMGGKGVGRTVASMKSGAGR
jgi:CO/xanthine dehydrogenase Mo-binding subunit